MGVAVARKLGRSALDHVDRGAEEISTGKPFQDYNRCVNIQRLVHILQTVAKNGPAVGRAITRSKKRDTGPKDWFSGVDDTSWLWMNTTGRKRLKPIAALVPGLPDSRMQAVFTGDTDDDTLRAGFEIYRLFKGYYEAQIGPISSCRGILDFGCGWGRIIRFFLRDVSPEKIVGVDYEAEVIQACRDTNKWCKFTLIEPYPPTSLPSGAFDLIYLFSVFSHLPEEMHWALLKEFHRLLVPGGLLVATTRRRDFIQYCQSLRDDPNLQEMPDYLSCSAEVFRNMDESLATYDGGLFCYDRYEQNEGRSSFWGEACIPKTYVERRWGEVFEVCDYVDDPKVCPQNVIVARKRV